MKALSYIYHTFNIYFSKPPVKRNIMTNYEKWILTSAQHNARLDRLEGYDFKGEIERRRKEVARMKLPIKPSKGLGKILKYFR